ncbi:UDP-N-acetylmuramoyl-L-alanyl-D-glutamate--2,6-diaminopimelate ligase [Halopseudomonas pelagia]|uniref:UDP-N-acetylmuramoyl-L-alanyl-D-glutamate--2, 6-diaminopimelate ligase n=1 Tax=Halopseudomonas pelagia TaxID=553151 RepID=UPI000491DA46|nr:UDP-N-acetylmuramoyl-L-alanyl-D-glutamate--2,6-diaminopimelate ligase [Halopseudomonas pelagia]
MNLAQLFPQWQGEPVMIDSLALDSRQVKPGCLFLAVPGLKHDGRQHIAQAQAAGAAAVAYEAQGAGDLGCSLPALAIDGLAGQLSAIAGRFYGNPSQQLRVVGITGTNGKTSVSQMLAQALGALGEPCGVIGTLGSGMPDALLDHGMTTPDALRVQQQLAQLRKLGAKAVSMEVSSHALQQGRVAAVDFDLGIFTNLSRDHLDYHGDMASYAAAKALLFERPLRAAVINLDDPFATQLLPRCTGKVTTYSLNNSQADIHCSDIRYDQQGIIAQVHVGSHVGGHMGEIVASLSTPLLGAFNLANLLAVLGGLCALGVAAKEALAELAKLQAPAGRMQRLGGDNKPVVVVDYAHTPDALEKALTALRAHAQGKLTCVFGCGGDRDAGKRALMGRVAEQGADQLVVTDDNPRSEASASIIEQILQGIEQPQAVRVIASRAQAIHNSITQAQAGDLILLAGKGHETYQEINGVRQPFSDIEQAERALREWEAAHA